MAKPDKARAAETAKLAVTACMSFREIAAATNFRLKDVDDYLNGRRYMSYHTRETIEREIHAYMRKTKG